MSKHVFFGCACNVSQHHTKAVLLLNKLELASNEFSYFYWNSTCRFQRLRHIMTQACVRETVLGFSEGVLKHQPCHTNGGGKEACVTAPHHPAHSCGNWETQLLSLDYTKVLKLEESQARACKSLAESKALGAATPTSHVFLDSTQSSGGLRYHLSIKISIITDCRQRRRFMWYC